jgi:hypothetical protein
MSFPLNWLINFLTEVRDNTCMQLAVYGWTPLRLVRPTCEESFSSGIFDFCDSKPENRATCRKIWYCDFWKWLRFLAFFNHMGDCECHHMIRVYLVFKLTMYYDALVLLKFSPLGSAPCTKTPYNPLVNASHFLT